ncbi:MULTISPECIES: hypothetical protein [Shewanella]|uniref:hypothetical protein n=1 Tax=Shewanella TaxID=22 RepID=UPI000AF1D8A5|nr:MULTISPECIES: hypothetical protein [Shewanella]MBO2658140.1 hypothetical protein [Shewanella algae]NJI87202.1 hypothetical protein [Shewanella sp. Iso12]NKZ40840.1 hypothetical protein [Shewanella algae]QTE79880.1 hypothetical protein E1N14_009865 [Shewanella algae]
MIRMLTTRKKASSTPLSRFVREADSRHKKRVYKKAIDEAIKEQNYVIEMAKQTA